MGVRELVEEERSNSRTGLEKKIFNKGAVRSREYSRKAQSDLVGRRN